MSGLRWYHTRCCNCDEAYTPEMEAVRATVCLQCNRPICGVCVEQRMPPEAGGKCLGCRPQEEDPPGPAPFNTPSPWTRHNRLACERKERAKKGMEKYQREKALKRNR